MAVTAVLLDGVYGTERKNVDLCRVRAKDQERFAIRGYSRTVTALLVPEDELSREQ